MKGDNYITVFSSHYRAARLFRTALKLISKEILPHTDSSVLLEIFQAFLLFRNGLIIVIFYFFWVGWVPEDPYFRTIVGEVYPYL